MRIDILTLFPEMFAPLDSSMIGRARQKELVEINVHYLRDWALDKHQITDERLYGGGAGMVLKAEPLALATDAVRACSRPRVIVTSPAGRPFTQTLAQELAAEEQLILICGHYEGIDQRFIDAYATDVISLGDFVLTGGEIAALTITDAVTRLLPGVLGDERAALEESFSDGLLEYPQYTRPPEWRGREVPAVLQNGNHAEIAAWRRRQSLALTLRQRPDLLPGAQLSAADAQILGELRREQEQPFRLYLALLHYPVYNKKKQTVATSIANLDLHDIARVAQTYALAGFFVVQPLAAQRQMATELLDYWQNGFGADYNPDRAAALSQLSLSASLEEAIAVIREREQTPPRLIATGAGITENMVAADALRERMRREGGPWLLLLGTGWGLSQEVITAADYRLQPIYGREGYNHLSVRAAAAILCDRLLGRDK